MKIVVTNHTFGQKCFLEKYSIINDLIYLGLLTKSRQSTTNCLDLKTLDKEISGDDVLYVCGRPFF